MMLALLWLTALPPPPPPHSCSARPLSDTWITFSDYPLKALSEDMWGDVRIAIHMDATGCPTACETVDSSGYPLLDETSCRLMMERFRSRPKLDENWRPIPATVVKTIRWRLP